MKSTSTSNNNPRRPQYGGRASRSKPRMDGARSAAGGGPGRRGTGCWRSGWSGARGAICVQRTCWTGEV